MPYGKRNDKYEDKKCRRIRRSDSIRRRKELHYTQAFLAEFTGFSVSFISDVERGKATAEIGKTLRLLMILGLDLSVERRA